MPALSQKEFRAIAADLQAAAVVPISRERACQLLQADGILLLDLLSEAQAARARFKPGAITYSRKVFLPLTNLCRDY